MNVLLLSMPDSFEHTPSLTMRMPNGALASLAGNVDPHHRVAVADLVLVQRIVPETVTRLVDDRAAGRRRSVGHDVSAQDGAQGHRARPRAPARRDASSSAATTRASRRRSTKTPSSGVDFIVRGEGDLTFRELLRALESGAGLRRHRRPVVPRGGGVRPQSRRARSAISTTRVRPPNRAARVLDGLHDARPQVDIVETSRGCTYDCSFCSIIEMRGRNFHTWSFDRVIADIRDAHDRGARAIFLVDDNITLNVARFKALCEAIIDAGLQRHRLHRAGHDVRDRVGGDELARADARGGIPLRVPRHRERARPGPGVPARDGEERAARRRPNRRQRHACAPSTCSTGTACSSSAGSSSATRTTRASRSKPTSTFARRYVDWPYIQHPTPYPGHADDEGLPRAKT